MTLGIRSDLTPQALASAVRGVVRGIDPDVPLQRIETVRDVYRASLARRRFQTTLVGAFALLALTLGCIGIYGVAGHAAAQRADEIRMRMVLGARPAEVTRLIVTEELRPTLFGVAAGLLVALGAARLAASQLFGVTTTDLPTFSLSALLLASVSVLAAWLAARRATRGPLRPR